MMGISVFKFAEICFPSLLKTVQNPWNWKSLSFILHSTIVNMSHEYQISET
jgi:hypothetical protein